MFNLQLSSKVFSNTGLGVRVTRTVILVVVTVCISLPLCCIGAPVEIEKVFADGALGGFFTNETEYSSSDEFFGINPMHVKEGQLYLGIGTSLPAKYDGAVIATYTEGSTAPTLLSSLNEQGIMDLSSHGNNLISLGADPCCGDLFNDSGQPGSYSSEWDWGNAYFIDTVINAVTKRRNLPNVIHGWGSWYDEINSILYYAGSGHMADTPLIADVTPSGLLFSTTNSGELWTLLADRNSGAGNYRTYDVIGIENNLYIQWNDTHINVANISKSSDYGATWQQIPNASVRSGTRLYNVAGSLVALGADTRSFIKIDADDAVTTHPFEFSTFAYHTMSQTGDGEVYVPTSNGQVMRTTDFDTWELVAVADGGTSFSTSYYWEEKEWLMLGNWGANANLWKADFSGEVIDPSECSSSITLSNSEWYMMSIPCANVGTVAETIGLLDGIGIKGTDWDVYRFDAPTRKYVVLEADEPFQSGAGYWIIQLSGDDIVLSVSGESVNLSADISITSTGNTTWNLIGNPFKLAVKMGDITLTTNASGQEVLSLSEAKDANMLHDQLFVWENGVYTALTLASDILHSWKAAWVAALPDSAGIEPKLHLPSDSPPPPPPPNDSLHQPPIDLSLQERKIKGQAFQLTQFAS